MRWWRISYRLAGIVAMTLVIYLLRIIPRPVLSRRGNTDRKWSGTLFMLWARLMRRLIGMRVTVRGPLPGPSSFLVTNHLGYIDIVLLASCLRAVFVAKNEVAGWPLLGRAVRSVGTIFIDRGSNRDLHVANCRIQSAIEQGGSIVLFAEGTSSGGDRVLPLKSSLLAVPAAQRLPVTCGAIHYETPAGSPAASEAVCWWGDKTFFSHLMSLLALPGFDAALHFGTQTLVDEDRKALANRLHDSIVALHAEFV